MEENRQNDQSDDLIEKIKAAVHKGNVTKIRVSREGKEIVTIPVTVGAVAGVASVAASPWIIVVEAMQSAISKYAFDCRFELIREDGSSQEI